MQAIWLAIIVAAMVMGDGPRTFPLCQVKRQEESSYGQFYRGRYEPQLFRSDYLDQHQKVHQNAMRAVQSYPFPSDRELVIMSIQLLEAPLSCRLPLSNASLPLEDWIWARNEALEDLVSMDSTWELLRDNEAGLGAQFLEALLNGILVNDRELLKSVPRNEGGRTGYDMMEPAWETIVEPLLNVLEMLSSSIPYKSQFGLLLCREETAMRLSVLLGSPDGRERYEAMKMLHTLYQRALQYCDEEGGSEQHGRRLMNALLGLIHDGISYLKAPNPSDTTMRASSYLLNLFNLILQVTGKQRMGHGRNGSFSGRFHDQMLKHIFKDLVLPLFDHPQWLHFQVEWQALYEQVFTMLEDSPDCLDTLQEAFLSKLFAVRRNGNRSREVASARFKFLLGIFIEKRSAWLSSLLLPLFFNRIFTELRKNASTAVRQYMLGAFHDAPFLEAFRPKSAKSYPLTAAKAFLYPLFDWLLDSNAAEQLQREEPTYKIPL